MGAKHKGNQPRQGKLFDDTFENYELWIYRWSGPWWNFKLIAKPSIRLPKANFWISWNHSEQRFSRKGDVGRLVEHHPEVAQRLEQLFQSRDWPAAERQFHHLEA